MKLSLILLLVAVFNVTASVYSQSVKLNLDFKNAPLEKVFQEIQEQTEFDFFYKNEYLPSKTINKTYNNEKIDKVLDEVLEGTGLVYRILNKDIVVTTAQTGDEVITAQQKVSVSGKVTDLSGAPLPGVTVVVKETTTGIITDVGGNYSLPMFLQMPYWCFRLWG